MKLHDKMKKIKESLYGSTMQIEMSNSFLEALNDEGFGHLADQFEMRQDLTGERTYVLFNGEMYWSLEELFNDLFKLKNKYAGKPLVKDRSKNKPKELPFKNPEMLPYKPGQDAYEEEASNVSSNDNMSL